MSRLPVTGGCQCGAVRYALSAQPGGAHFCHCRMCQRAVGGPFAALAGVTRSQLSWTRGQAAVFSSSSVADRGFCSACGTPLFFAYKDGDWISLTIGSLDHPEAHPIEIHYGVESRLPWLQLCDGLPEEETAASETSAAKLAGMVSHQRNGA